MIFKLIKAIYDLWFIWILLGWLSGLICGFLFIKFHTKLKQQKIKMINKHECWEVGGYYIVFKEGVDNAAEELMKEFIKNKNIVDEMNKAKNAEVLND